MKSTKWIGVVLVILTVFVFVGTAQAISFSSSMGDLSASVSFEIVSGNLQVTLTNTSTADVLVPADVLTAVFFTLDGNPTLTPVSALLNDGSVVFFGPDGGGNVGGEWAYANGLSGAPGDADEGISSTGLGLFGNYNFNGSNLQPPEAVNGLNYGITSAGDDPATGNKPVTGGSSGDPVALIKNSVVFTLSGIPVGFDLVNGITDVSFQYGTALDEPNIPIPEPATLLLVGSGLAGLGVFRRKKA